MKTIYIIKEKTGRWNFAVVSKGRQIMESVTNGYVRQHYRNRGDCRKVARNNLADWPMIEVTRYEYNKLFR